MMIVVPLIRTWRDADGKLHRDGGPAVEFADGDKEWWLHGRLHSINYGWRDHAQR